MAEEYDLVVVGGGISGASVLYALAKFTDVEQVALFEKEPTIGAINTAREHNSQTLHFGDIETNYSLEKARSVKTGAETLAGYLEATDPERTMYDRRSKMVIAVGDQEVKRLERRYEEKGFGDLYPKLELIGRERIAALEPAVVEGRDPDVPLRALYTPDGYVVDYGETARSLVETAQEEPGVDVFTDTPVEGLVETASGYAVRTTSGTVTADGVIVSAGSHSLQFAKRLGYGENMTLLPVAGSFFLAKDMLQGKVYTLQMAKLPFAAVHGDAEVHDPGVTRFGPTAKPVPALERRNLSTVSDFLDVFGFDFDSLASYATILADRVLLPYVLRNLIYDLPEVGKRAFLPHVQKVVPSASVDDIERATGYGGVRPQIVNTATRSLDMGEAKIEGEDVIFNITPSPGASTCLKNARRDAQTALSFLDGEYTFDEAGFDAATIDQFPRGD
mgnify:FL=1